MATRTWIATRFLLVGSSTSSPHANRCGSGAAWREHYEHVAVAGNVSQEGLPFCAVAFGKQLQFFPGLSEPVHCIILTIRRLDSKPAHPSIRRLVSVPAHQCTNIIKRLQSQLFMLL